MKDIGVNYIRHQFNASIFKLCMVFKSSSGKILGREDDVSEVVMFGGHL